MPSFQVHLIEAKSDLPLYVITNGVLYTRPPIWLTLWQPPNNPAPNSFTAFNMASANLSLRLTCSFSADLVGKTLSLQGVLNNVPAVGCVVHVTGTGVIVAQPFILLGGRPGPVAYRGPFLWRLLEGTQVIATFGTQTRLELYTASSPAPALWPSYGVAVSVLRHYLPEWNLATRVWLLPQFYNFTAQSVFGSAFRYDTVYGAPRFAQTGLGGFYRLERYINELEAGLTSAVNCYDMAGIVQIILSVYRSYNAVTWNFIQPCGYINQTQ